MSAGLSSRAVTWALFAAFAAHNIEEVLTMGRFLDAAGTPFLLTPFLIAVSVVTAGALALTALSTASRPSDWARDGMRILAAVMVVNAVVPHIPLAALSGGYAPGLITAVLVNLPLGAAYLIQTRPARRGSSPTPAIPTGARP